MGILSRANIKLKKMGAGLLLLLMVAIVAAQLPAQAANTFPHAYDLVSVNNVDGTGINQPATLTSGSLQSKISFDGSKILFSTNATNLPDPVTVSGQSAGYLRDMNTGVTVRVDKSQSGVVADGTSENHVMSSTGRYIAFRSKATNLIDGTANSSHYRTYLKDMQTGNVENLTPTINTSDPNHVGTAPISVSDDGRLVLVHTTTVNDFIPGKRSSSGSHDIVMLDRLKGTWVILNQSDSGTIANDSISRAAGASCDGSLILLSSYATNLVSGYSGSSQHIFLVDIRNGQRIQDITHGATGSSQAIDVSCNGRYVLYDTTDRVHMPYPTGLPTSTTSQVVRYDRITGERQYVSSKSDGTFSSYGAAGFAVSDKGDVLQRVHTYSSGGSPKYTVNLKHLSDGSGTLESVQHNTNGLLFEGQSGQATISSDGRYVVATSKDSVALGIPGSVNGSGQPIINVIRIATGL